MQCEDGELAQVARAIGSQSIGRGFESHILHVRYLRKKDERCLAFLRKKMLKRYLFAFQRRAWRFCGFEYYSKEELGYGY